MVQDHWFVGFRSQFVTCTAYTWSQRDGYHTRGLGRLTEYAFSYLGPQGGSGRGEQAKVTFSVVLSHPATK